MLGVVVAIFLFTTVRTDSPAKADLTYSQFSKAVSRGDVKSVSYDPSNGHITGSVRETRQDGKGAFTSSGPNNDLQPTQLKNLAEQGDGTSKYVRDVPTRSSASCCGCSRSCSSSASSCG